MVSSKNAPLMTVLQNQTVSPPPVWLMRQAGRYLPEYRAVRKKAGSFLDLCYTPDLATEVTLQPVKRFGLDAAILFADILLIPQALGMDVWFVEGEGPRLAWKDEVVDPNQLRPVDDIHEVLSPIYQTVRNVSEELPASVPLIGFAGAPWTVATYMVAGRGTPDQGPARRLYYEDPARMLDLLDRIADATVLYLSKQIEAGASVIKLFDTWAGVLSGPAFDQCVAAPLKKITSAMTERYPDVPIIGFPRGAGARYTAFTDMGFSALALDQSVPIEWASSELQPKLAVQGNLDPMLMVVGGDALDREVRRIRDGFAGGPHIFNLGHGITPDANPDHVARLIDVLREPVDV